MHFAHFTNRRTATARNFPHESGITYPACAFTLSHSLCLCLIPSPLFPLSLSFYSIISFIPFLLSLFFSLFPPFLPFLPFFLFYSLSPLSFSLFLFYCFFPLSTFSFYSTRLSRFLPSSPFLSLFLCLCRCEVRACYRCRGRFRAAARTRDARRAKLEEHDERPFGACTPSRRAGVSSGYFEQYYGGTGADCSSRRRGNLAEGCNSRRGCFSATRIGSAEGRRGQELEKGREGPRGCATRAL